MPALQKNFVNIFFVFAGEFCIEKWRGFLVNSSGLRLPQNEARKILEKFGENSEQNSGQNSGRKIEKFGINFRSAPVYDLTKGSQRALRDRLMSRGKNCLPTVSRQFLTRNYPRPNCLLKCLPNCLSPQERAFILFQNYPRGEGNCETSERQKLSRGNFCPATSICSLPAHWVKFIF